MAEHEAGDGRRKDQVIRLYRGLSRAYRSGKLDKEKSLQGPNFTDCPMAALIYARGRNGVLLVVDLPEDAEISMSEAIWSLDGSGPRRFMLRGGAFDPYVVAEIPAKELRAEIRKKGVRSLSDSDKSRVLVRYLKQRISQRRAPRPFGGRTRSISVSCDRS